MNRRALLAGLGLGLTALVEAPAHARHAQRPWIEGRMRSGELLAYHGRRGVPMSFDDETALPTTPRGLTLFAAPHDAPGRHTLAVGRARFPVAIRRRAQPASEVHVPALDEDDRAAHADALAHIARVRRRVLPDDAFTRGFALPIVGEVSSEFGVARAHGVHLGIDLVAPIGAAVRAPADGVVTLSIETPVFGRTLVIDHGHALTTSLLHLSATLAREGTRVRRGDVVARSGATGRVTGAHLDWRVAWRDVDVDPRGVLALLPARA
ncbi:MAG: M23 family metallopeptidase [Deltaproteobacteria bacterium]|nr:M23 family metallopeptidase [Deltaproteobacteria bacterium]